jgi:hypothetical protein
MLDYLLKASPLRAREKCPRGHEGRLQMPEFTVEELFEMSSAVGLTEESPWRNYVGRLDGEVVTTASLDVLRGL